MKRFAINLKTCTIKVVVIISGFNIVFIITIGAYNENLKGQNNGKRQERKISETRCNRGFFGLSQGNSMYDGPDRDNPSMVGGQKYAV